MIQTLSINENDQFEPITVQEGEHVVGSFCGNSSGPTLVVFGAIHGNEHSGVIAMKRMLPGLSEIESKLRGRVFLLAGNTRAINKNIRFEDADLNRHWTVESVKRNSPDSKIRTNRAEDIEQTEILEVIGEVFDSAEDEIYALDLHSTSAESTPFAMIGDTLRNREFARQFPATILLGIEEQLDGTILEYINNMGAVTLGFEAGQHTSLSSVRNHEALIWLALAHSGILAEEDADVRRHEEVLSTAMGGSRLVEIRYRHAITEKDEFRMNPGYKNFQPIKKGEVLALSRNRKVRANESGLILMPLYQAQGQDGFFIGREISTIWLWLSKILRRLKLGSLMRFLPGVRVHPADPESLIVNTRIARILPLQIFHLLGFRKTRRRNDELIVSRRKHDTISPFIKR
ncbi:MAG: succinylglutamate desuccinylase/aspartoacylase family protein [Pyrinomonadaceae bacterium]